MRARILSLACLSAVSILPGFCQSKNLPVALLPKDSAKLSDFCPKGWEVENKISTDLNRDNKKDVVLQLITSATEKQIELETTQYRAIVVVFNDGHDRYKLADYADKLLLCTTCGGQLGANVELDPDFAAFKVSQTGGGGNDGFGYVFTFAFGDSNKFVIRKVEFTHDSDRVANVGKTISLNFQDHPTLRTTITGGKKDKVTSKAITSRTIYMRDIDLNKLAESFKGYPVQ